jgi:hypothetical protein
MPEFKAQWTNKPRTYFNLLILFALLFLKLTILVPLSFLLSPAHDPSFFFFCADLYPICNPLCDNKPSKSKVPPRFLSSWNPFPGRSAANLGGALALKTILANYIVRVYRFEKNKPAGLVGVVEEVGMKGGKKAFSNLSELWDILSSSKSVKNREKHLGKK